MSGWRILPADEQSPPTEYATARFGKPVSVDVVRSLLGNPLDEQED